MALFVSAKVNFAFVLPTLTSDVAEAVQCGQLRGYGGDVWFPQPAPKDHPWRTMQYKNAGGNAMVPHMSGTTLDAQARYAAGVKKILDNYFNNKPQNPVDVIVEGGSYATKYSLSQIFILTLLGRMDNANKHIQNDNAVPTSLFIVHKYFLIKYNNSIISHGNAISFMHSIQLPSLPKKK